MSRTRGPCKCKWCPQDAIPRAGLVQVCEACQAKVDRLVRLAREVQANEGLPDSEIGRRLAIAPDSWRRIRYRLDENPHKSIASASIDPNRSTGPLASAPTEKSARLWEGRAACGGHADPDIFFPESRKAAKTIAIAQRICAGCDVRPECAASRQSEGVWAGVFYASY